MANFVHLHLHTEYSLLDGAVRIVQSEMSKETQAVSEKHPLAKALKDLGMHAVAITDHGNMYGAHTFARVLREEGIKPIIGEEFYVADDMYVKTPDTLKKRYHLILLAKNATGYKNLMYLSTIAFTEGFYMRPRVDLAHIAEHSEGLICLSACLAGKVPRLLLENKYEEAKAYAIKMRDMFAPGDFYIELQDHGMPEDQQVIYKLKQIADEIGVKTVATNDVHYLKKEDADMQDTMMCITLGCKKNDTKEGSARFSTDEYYLKSEEEMLQLFGWCEEAVYNTAEIADKVEDYFVVELKDEQGNDLHIIPVYKNDEMGDMSESEYIRYLAYEGLHKKYSKITPELENRVEYELGVIHDCGYDGYFLIVWDYVNAARKMGIPVGPGRGSGCGSVVAYCIGITDIDPLRFDLLFERFLNKERVSMPDFDIDFCYVRRQEVIDYCVQKYGKDNVSQIIAYSTMSAKAVVKDVARVMDVPYAESNNWVKDIPVGKVLLSQVLTPGNEKFSPDFKKLYDENPIAHTVIDTAVKLEGMPRQTSMHAAGVVICRDPIVEYCALSTNNNVVTTQFDKTMIEQIGLLKMDFLGLKTLTDINEALKLIKEDRGVDIDFSKLEFEDKKIYELISSGDCEAVFQLESPGMKRFMSQLQPTTIEDVIAGISMFRPGPMQFIGDFVNGKHHPEKVTYLHPLLKDILENTYGCIVYQEQVMQIAQKVAGFSFGGADIMRRAMSKKKKQVLNAMRDVFVHGGTVKGDATNRYNVGAVANGVDEETANKLFEQIMKFAEYAFNKSHAAAYTVLTYQTAWLKCYYPTHFLVAVVNNRITNADEVKHYMNYLRQTGVNILPPDINHSKKLFSIEGSDVRYGLMGIKNVGEQALEYVIAERQAHGQFKDIRDFFERCLPEEGDVKATINKRMVESLIKGGAFDCFGKSRATLLASYERIMDTVAADKRKRLNGQMSLFDDLIEDSEIVYDEVGEYPKKMQLALEKEVLGMYLSGHPLDDYSDDKHEFDFDTGMIVIEQADETGNIEMVPDVSLDGKKVCFGCIVSSYEKKLTKKQQKFIVGKLEDKIGTIAFTAFPRVYERYGSLLESDSPLKITGRIDLSDEAEPKINIDSAELWQNSTKAEHKEETRAEGVLYVLILNNLQKEQVSETLKLYPGNCPCHAQVKLNGVSKLVEFPMKTDALNPELIARLVELLGEAGVKFVKK